MRNLDSLPTACQKKKTSKDQVARQDSRHRSPEKGMDAGMQSVHTLQKFAQLRWTGHVTRMPDERFPKKILYGELQVGKRSHGGQKKRYKDTLKASLKDFNIPSESWEQIAQDRTKWRGLIKKGAGEYESKKNQRSRAETCTAESQS